ncbi:hypothetical protein KM1_332420 [Entamoeba histolytica HM-3:IMSS]|uniref:Uncharacterized protein n=2 Tax=Entamoeba histolytica TaxID=5759 RepID=M2RW45_ENTHI|nr:Hypothetical protein EHI5A_278470 [Entamoeba histolytica KU27]EMS16006.1 hypothetical protein KM1_332420 [Entamoeba histolytica HM-3:IMSS]
MGEKIKSKLRKWELDVIDFSYSVRHLIFYFDRMDADTLSYHMFKTMKAFERVSRGYNSLKCEKVLSLSGPSIDGKPFKGNTSENAWKVNKIEID